MAFFVGYKLDDLDNTAERNNSKTSPNEHKVVTFGWVSLWRAGPGSAVKRGCAGTRLPGAVPVAARGCPGVPLFLLEPASPSPPHRSGSLLQVCSKPQTEDKDSAMRCTVLDSGKLLFANARELGTGLFKLGGCETAFIFCDQFCLSVGDNLILQCKGCLGMVPRRT